MNKNKKILFLTASLNSGGAERQMVTLALRWKLLNIDVEFLVYGKDDFYSSILKKNDIVIHWKYLPKYLDRMIQVRRFIRNGNYDAVVSFLEVENFLNNFAALGSGKKWKTVTGERSSHEKIFQGIKAKLFCKFMSFSDYIVCNSNNARKMWLRHYPEYSDKLRVIYNTVLIPQVTSIYIPKKDNRLNIIVIATLYDVKNPVNVVKALSLMTEEERRRVHVDWYGKIPAMGSFDNQKAYNEVIALIEEENLYGVITFHEPTLDIHNKMNEADVVGLFSVLEGLPNTIAEGMAIGKPVIMSKVSDYEVLVDSTNGFLCDPMDCVSIKNVILEASYLTVEQLLLMAENSKKKSERLFSGNVSDNLWSDILEF